MNKEDFIRKVSSRKFWAMIIAVIISLAAIFGWSDATTQQLIALITAISSLVIYILAESYVDGKRISETDTELIEDIIYEIDELCEDINIVDTKVEAIIDEINIENK